MQGCVRTEDVLLAQSPSHRFPPCLSPFPQVQPHSTPTPWKVSQGAGRRTGSPTEAGQAEQAGMAEPRTPKNRVWMYRMEGAGIREKELKRREGLPVFGETEKENSPERSREQKQRLSNKERWRIPAPWSPMAPHCLPDKVQTR